MLTSTMPVAGIVVALAAAAASVTATGLTADVLAPHYSPLHLGLLFLPELAGALLTAVALGVVLKRRELHYLPLGRNGVPRGRDRRRSASRSRPRRRSR